MQALLPIWKKVQMVQEDLVLILPSPQRNKRTKQKAKKKFLQAIDAQSLTFTF